MKSVQRLILLGMCAIAILGFALNSAHADFFLQITEIWPGNTGTGNVTDDWFEVTNGGDMAWEAATHGDLWYDDESAEPADSVVLSGVPSIMPGESAIFIIGESDGVTDWETVWTPELTLLPQVGFGDGAGLGAGGDVVNLWISAVMPTAGILPDLSADYPDASANGGQSWDVLLGQFSTVGNVSGAVMTAAQNDTGQAAIASPGSIPEPGALILLATGLASLALPHRRR